MSVMGPLRTHNMEVQMTHLRSTTLMAAFCILSSPIHAQTNTELSKDDAIAIALNAQQGTIVEAEKDEYNGRVVYDIEVLTAASEEVEFKVDAETGAILDKWTDDDPTDDTEGSE